MLILVLVILSICLDLAVMWGWRFPMMMIQNLVRAASIVTARGRGRPHRTPGRMAEMINAG